MKSGLKFVLLGKKMDQETKIVCPIDDKSIDFVEGIECHINKV
jgi:hypothetical protein